METKFYGKQNKPQVGEIVQVIFNIREDDHAIGELTEYEGSVILPYSLATKKKKIRSINKLIPLDKPLAVIVDEFDEKNNIGSVNMAYMDEVDENFHDKFITNSKLLNGVYQICSKYGINFETMWNEIILKFISGIDDDNYPITRINENIDKFKVFVNNDKFFEEFSNKFYSVRTASKFKKTVGIISNEGVVKTKELFSQSLDDDKFRNDITIKYANTPNFTIETTMSENLIDEFIEIIKVNSKNFNNLYVKVY